MPTPKRKSTQAEQSVRFREAAKKAEVGDAKEFERAFKKIVPVKRTRASGSSAKR